MGAALYYYPAIIHHKTSYRINYATSYKVAIICLIAPGRSEMGPAYRR